MDREPYNVSALHPVMSGAAARLLAAVTTSVYQTSRGNFVLQPFEGFRHPLRQHHLFAGGKVTKARPWQSAHQYGLAVDFAGLRIDHDGHVVAGTWSWELPDRAWVELKAKARIVGLDIPISWDRGHVVHPLFAHYKNY